MLLLITNRKSYTRFQLIPKSTTLDDPELTLNGYYALCCITHIALGAHHKNLNEDRPILSGIVASSKIRFMWGSLQRGLQMRVGSSKMAIFAYFTCYIFRTSTFKATIIILFYSPTVSLQRHRNRWPWMTLNDHYALKSVSSSANNELAFLAFGQNCSKIWRVTYTQSATKL